MLRFSLPDVGPLLGTLLNIALVIAVAASVLAFCLAYVPTRVVLQPEGVELRWLWRHRFIPFREITDAYEYEDNSPRGSLPRGVRLVHGKGADLVGLKNILKRDRFLAAIRDRVERARHAAP
ncbi:hypothetical protein [Labilithrix luteola]|nr:hypothetical protein [Labilithrix luteola]